MSASKDLIQLFSDEHEQIQSLFNEYKHASNNGKRRDKHELIKLLSMHLSKLDRVIVPAIEKYEGSKIGQHALESHKEMLALIEQLEDKKGCDRTCDELVTKIYEFFTTHCSEMLTSLLPYLKERMPVSDYGKLTSDWIAAASTAPTHPHSSLPQTGMGASITHTVAGAFDKLKDKISGGGRETETNEMASSKCSTGQCQ